MAATCSDEPLTLTELLIELRREYGEDGGDDAAFSYGRLWTAVASGRVPAVRRGRQWRVQRQHLATAAKSLGLPAARHHAAA